MSLSRHDLAGHWHLSRRIDDRKAGQAGRMDGHCVLTPEHGDALHYQEEGLLTLGDGPALEARRAYRWVFAGDAVEVFFADGAPFHSFRPDGTTEGTPHLCGEDLYRVTYDFDDFPRWTATWAVAGPRKDYTSVTRYWREA